MVQFFKITLAGLIFALGSLFLITTAQSESTGTAKTFKNYQQSKPSKKAKSAPVSFRVQKVTFKEILVNQQIHLAVIIEFNKPVDAASIAMGSNCRVLKEKNGFWIDAYPSAGSNLRVVDRFVTWAMGSPINTNDPHKVHLRGTIKAVLGEYLDCNNDGKGEGGYLPAYNSQIYRPKVVLLEIIPKY